MFMLYAIPIGLLVGVALRGSVRGLAQLSFRFGWVVLVGLLVQVILFEGAVAEAVGEMGALLYVGSTAIVVAAIAANARTPGIPIVTLGAALNLLVIVANGGYMPAGAEAYRSAGVEARDTYSNTRVIAEPVLAPLSDVIVLPAGLPLRNVISVGDLVIAAGTAATIVFAMRGRKADPIARTRGPAS
jgi:hypothetical protein